ncbi:SCO7613 C-terminal domain-containing membrane protein [Streptomyces sp. NPDC101158]|uniref:SCO7613 C-terminal domain-containing membrane protein n=1 Tax=Streptomyces sp. NPDC101158 TaxID=3366117 RepID=UPI00381B5AE9
MDSSLPPAEELVLVDRELARLDAHRAQLLARRDWLLRVLHPAVAAPAAWPVPTPPGTAAPQRPEASPRSTQNVLLTLGGVLLTVAALVFTLVSWGSMGIGGRASVLAVVTSAALLAPVALLRRGLVSTAESVGALGLVLTLLDAYALHRVALPDADGLTYAAAASAVLAAAWAGYGSALTRLRVPRPAAVVAAQLPLPLGVLAVGGGELSFAWAGLATGVLDLALVLALLSRGKLPGVRVTAGIGAAALGGWALLTGLFLSFAAPGRAAPLLVAVAAVLLLLAVRHAPTALASAAVAGLAAIAAAGGLLRAAVPGVWAVPGYALCGVVLAAVVWTVHGVRGRRGDESAPTAGSGSPRPRMSPTPPEAPSPAPAAVPAPPAPGRASVRDGLVAAGGGVLGLAAAWAVPPVAAGLLAPLVRTTGVWSGAHAERVLDGYPATAPLVLLLAAVALAVVPRLWARCGALALAWALLTALPVSLDLSYGVTVALQLVATAAMLAVAVRPAGAARGLVAATVPGPPAPGPPAPGAGGAPRAGVRPAEVLGWLAFACGLGSAGGAVGLALDTRGVTFGVLGVLVVLFGGVALLGEGARRLVASCGGVLAVGGLVAAGAAAAQPAPAVTGLVLLAVPAGTAAVGARLRRHPVALAVEGTGAAVGLCALGLAAERPALLALALALGGVVAAATAVRPERRRVASWAAAGLFLLATWVRLAVWEVTTPEAYTLPVTVPALVVGVLRRRRDPEASSWTAYGPGLAATLVPSLFAAWTDPQWARPLLLGIGTLVVTLLGARFRLQALLLLGGAALALDGLHELAPYVVQVVGALPRWLPPALAGLLLLAVGATYEQRLRDARRLRERLGRMR